MLWIETYVVLAIVCLLDLSGADFYNSTGFSAYTWPGLVSLIALDDDYETASYIVTNLQPFLLLNVRFLNFLSVGVQLSENVLD
jgi:hypothetical protein